MWVCNFPYGTFALTLWRVYLFGFPKEAVQRLFSTVAYTPDYGHGPFGSKVVPILGAPPRNEQREGRFRGFPHRRVPYRVVSAAIT